MSFVIYQANGTKIIKDFFNIDDVIKAMLDNPNDAYHRN